MQELVSKQQEQDQANSIEVNVETVRNEINYISKICCCFFTRILCYSTEDAERNGEMECEDR